MLNKRMDLNDEELMNVCGNYGDADKDNNVNDSMYNAGQCIEVFVDPAHIWTQSQKIIRKYFSNGHWCYVYTTLKSTNPHYKVTVNANSIEK